MPEDKVIPVRVALRCRPLISKEVNEGCQQCLQFTPNESQVIIGKDKAFTYDYVFSPQNLQPEVHSTAVHPLVKHILKGYNATVLAYGQTGSGKTYTMGGCYEASLREDQEEMGVIPRVLKELFQGIEERAESVFVVKVSYLEIHNEDINDLLRSPSKREPLSIREDINGGIKLPGLSEVTVSTYEDTMSCLQSGSQGRTTGSTAMNSTSSRSHAIFTINIEQKKKEDMDDFCSCKFHLVDLAGSERAKRTQAEGERFKEGININRGLLALGNVISALGDETQKRSHIPYRDSKLTRLLQDSLGGNSYTLMIACVSPADSNMEETLNTLRYADRARKIKNKPIVNRDPQTAEIMRLKQLVQQLQLQMINGGITPSLTVTSSSTSCTSSLTTMGPPNFPFRPVQMINGGTTPSLTVTSSFSSCTSSMTTVSIESSTDELKGMIERNKQLEEENDKLSVELRKAVDQSTNMCEKAIRLEVRCDKLKQRLSDLKKDTGVDLEMLSSSIDVENNPQLKEQIDKLKVMSEKINESEEEKEAEPQEYVEEEEDPEIESAPGTPDTRAMSKQYALRQAKLGRELQELNRLLEKKELLANQMTQNDDKMESLKHQYEIEKNHMETEINSLQKEKDNLHLQLEDARANTNANKVAEQRRKRLKELELQISELRKKMNEQTKLLRLKDQSDKNVSKLNTEIQQLKHARVQLMKQMKGDADEFRKWKQKKDKEVLQLQQKDRKRQFEIVKLQRENQKQQNILKRKSEEAAAANKRLKEALAKQKQVLQDRNSKLEKCDSTSTGSRVRSLLCHELEVRISIREAKYHLESLLSDRKVLSGQLNQLKERLDTSGPPLKKIAVDYYGSVLESSMEEEELKKQIKTLEQEISVRNIQITDLQQKIVDADQDFKGKTSYDSLHTMMEAKCAIKWLLEQAVSSRVDMSRVKGELKNSEEGHDENKEIIEKLEKELENLTKQHEEEMTKIRKQNEEKVLFLLKRNTKSKNASLDEDTKERLKYQQEEIDKLSNLHEELEKKTDECDSLKKQLTRAMYQGKTLALMPSISDPGASPFLSPTPKPKVKKQKKPENAEEEDSLLWEEDQDVSSEEDEAYPEWEDPDWERTPLFMRKRSVARRKTTFGKEQSKKSLEKDDSSKASPSSKCNCKGTCQSKKCSCNKNEITCTDDCGCKAVKCLNREKQLPQSTTPDTDEENNSVTTTLNSTFNIDDKDSQETPTSTTNGPHQNKRVLKTIQESGGSRSSDEFIKPAATKLSRTLNSDDSGNTSKLGGGIKKKRKLMTSSSSFFEPIQ